MEKLNCSVYEISDSIENLIAEGATVPLCVSGSSMNPFLISRRDVVYLRKHTENDLKNGSIVLFKRINGSLVLHRIKKVCSDGSMLLCGDAQSKCEKVEKSQIIACVSEIEQKGKRKCPESFYWKMLMFIWEFLIPIRPLFMRLWFKIRRIKNKK